MNFSYPELFFFVFLVLLYVMSNGIHEDLQGFGYKQACCADCRADPSRCNSTPR